MKIIRSKFFKYAVVLLVFGVWICFFDDYNLIQQSKMNDQLKASRKELQETRDAISTYKAEAKKIENDLEFIEETGRNQYLMKHADEDVYIFVKEDETGKLVPLEQ
jgi:cell division protein FtsB